MGGMQQITVSQEAVDRKAGMTLAELEAFVRDARTAGLPGDMPIRVTTGWASQIRMLEVAGEPQPRTVFTSPDLG